MCAQGENKALAARATEEPPPPPPITNPFIAYNRRSHVWMHCMDGLIDLSIDLSVQEIGRD